MRPTYIELENFLSFPNKVALELHDINNAVVCGPNGAGKSSLVVDSILFALFGKARKKPEELINDLADECKVRMVFDHHGKEYTVIRSITRKKPQKLSLHYDSTNQSERLLSETQEKLESILGFSYNLLLSTAIAQQDEINMLSSISPADREKIISEILSLEVWEQKKQKVLAILRDTKDIEKEINDLENQITVTNQLLKEELEPKMESLYKELEVPKTNLSLLEKEFEKYSQEFKNYERNKNIQIKLNSLEHEIKLLQERINSLPESTSNTGKLKEKLKENEKLIEEIIECQNELTIELDQNSKVLFKVQQLIPQTKILDKVPCVGMDIHSECQLLSNALNSQKDLEQLVQGRSQEETIKDYENKEEVLKTKLDELRKAKANLDTTDKKLANEIYQLEQCEKEAEKRSGLQESLNIKLKEYKDLESELENVDFDFNKYTNLQKEIKTNQDKQQLIGLQLVKFITQKENMDKEVIDLNKQLQKMQNEESEKYKYKILLSAYDEIPSLLFEQATPSIEAYTNEILQIISPGTQIELRTFKETKSNTYKKSLDVVSYTATGVRDFANLSGSERFRQSLALRLAISRYNRELNNVDIGFFVVDEGFGSLDTENVFIIKSALKNIASCFDLFLMVTHVPELGDTFSDKIIVNPTGKEKRIIKLKEN